MWPLIHVGFYEEGHIVNNMIASGNSLCFKWCYCTIITTQAGGPFYSSNKKHINCIWIAKLVCGVAFFPWISAMFVLEAASSSLWSRADYLLTAAYIYTPTVPFLSLRPTVPVVLLSRCSHWTAAKFHGWLSDWQMWAQRKKTCPLTIVSVQVRKGIVAV